MAAKKPATAQTQTINLTVTGAITANAKVTPGTSLRAALTANGGHKSSQFTFADEAGKPVSIDRKLSADLKIVATATAAATASAAAAKVVTGRVSGTTTNEANTPKAGAKATAAATPAVAKPVGFKVSITGSLKGDFTATAGQTLREVIRAAQPNSDYNRQSFVDGNGRAVSLDRKIEADYKLTSSARVNGG